MGFSRGMKDKTSTRMGNAHGILLGMELLNGIMGMESWCHLFFIPGVIDSNVTLKHH